MEVTVEIRANQPVLIYSGRLDEEAAPRFNRELSQWVERMLSRNLATLLLDFSEVTFICGVVLRSMLSMARRVRARGGAICIADPSIDVQETFEVIRFREIFESYGGKLTTGAPQLVGPNRAPGDTSQLDILFGDRALSCKDGDTLGSEGSLGAELFAGLPGVAARPVRFQREGSHWVATVAQEPGSVVRVDKQVIGSGQQAILRGDHWLQIGEVRLRLHVTLSESVTKESKQIDEQVHAVFSQAAEWIDKTLKE
ncbi:MAG: STAS domain-containing protein [Verrucomicrobia bacterium]|nr:STAS domain-containing protein [Verrucomicrobiota bacterium]